jgi:hypothetical protein
MYIGNILGQNKKSISVKVKDKVISLVGSASNQADILDIEEFSMKQPGVKNVIRLLKYSPSLVKKNVKKARHLEKKINYLFDGVKFVSINIYGEFAEVAGTVNTKADKVLVEKYIFKTLTVNKIINKLFVSKSL